MQFCANKLDKKDFFGRSDPFMVFYRSNEDGTERQEQHLTLSISHAPEGNISDFTKEITAGLHDVSDFSGSIKVEVYDWDRDGSHDFIGEFTTSYRELSRGQSQFNVYEVVNPKKKLKKRRYINSGTVTLLSFSVEAEHTFLDYIKAGYGRKYTQSPSSDVKVRILLKPSGCYHSNGVKQLIKQLWKRAPIVCLILLETDITQYLSLCRVDCEERLAAEREVGCLPVSTQIHFTVAIDFTASNGNPSQSTSLHYMNPYQMNAYAMALKAVGEIIQDYDSDKMFPALGFGAKLPPDGRVSHEFPLNGNVDNPYCNGMEGILEAYHESLKTVQLYGPTNFAPVINHVARYAAAVQDGSQYFVLLIITDGVISDMAQTKEAIVNAAKLPMSIIIVGVGQAEFDAMVELDGDDVRISSRGKLAERDIVQFVPFRDYMDRTGNHVLSMARLAKDVLAEIPEQLILYMKSRGIKPNQTPPDYSPPGLSPTPTV
ncbi:Copine-5 [Labeo rohita]|uniref:Copine-5 n=1 Tax=Labeo rohita TaxID=84645 RepID=A0ABQ8MHA9_LABRO|nr:Copine-5 [Labeo rohita]